VIYVTIKSDESEEKKRPKTPDLQVVRYRRYTNDWGRGFFRGIRSVLASLRQQSQMLSPTLSAVGARSFRLRRAGTGSQFDSLSAPGLSFWR
jgi:hypothetical protein